MAARTRCPLRFSLSSPAEDCLVQRLPCCFTSQAGSAQNINTHRASGTHNQTERNVPRVRRVCQLWCVREKEVCRDSLFMLAATAIATTASACEPWCLNPCHQLNGNIHLECGGCPSNFACSPGKRVVPNYVERASVYASEKGGSSDTHLFNIIDMKADYPYGTLPPSQEPTFSPRECRWQRNDSTRAIFFYHHGEKAILPVLDNVTERERSVRRAHVRTCVTSGYRGMIAGPFYTRPGEWGTVGMIFDIVSGSEQEIAFIGDAVDAKGQTVSFPPMHMHHIHFKMANAIHWHETHGDYAHGADGYQTLLPAGHCVVHHRNVATTVEAQINDVRGSALNLAMSADNSNTQPTGGRASDVREALLERRPGSPENTTEWYMRVVLKLHTGVQPCTVVSKLLLFHPRTPYAFSDLYERYDVGSTPRVFWWSYVMSRSGRLLAPGWIHSHRARHGGVFLVAGNHSLSSLTGADFSACARSSLPHCTSLNAARALLMQRAGGSLICQDDVSSVPPYVELPPSADQMVGGFYDRPSHYACRQHDFVAGEVVTVFSFSEPLWSAHLREFPQHTMMFFYFVDADRAHRSAFVKHFPPALGVWEVGTASYQERMPLEDPNRPMHMNVVEAERGQGAS